MTISRRTLLQTSTAAVAATSLPFSGCGKTSAPPAVSVDALLGQVTDLILNAYPETASSAGLDTGQYVGLKSKLTDRSAAGQAKIESDVRAFLPKLNAVDTKTLSPGDALNVDVVRTMFQTAVDGFDFKFGDNAVLNYNWSYRPSPYVVAQNTGAFVEIPSFLDSSHKIDNVDDVDAYLERMKAYAGQLDGETERLKRDGANGYVLPDFLLEKTIGQLQGALDRDSDSWGMTTNIVLKTALWTDSGVKSRYGHAGNIARDMLRPAILRQIDVLTALRPKANSDAGVWAKPRGDEYYDWALRASTTTTMSPDEVHQMGLDELAALQARMEPILQSIGYTNGTVGERMTALGKDPLYLFKEGDPGRDEIMAFIEDALTEIRALMPQAFETLVPGFLEVTLLRQRSKRARRGLMAAQGQSTGNNRDISGSICALLTCTINST